jgi:hypothetical protein
MKNINLIAVAVSLLLFSCGQGNKSADDKDAVKIPEAQIEFDDQKTENVYIQYLKVKNALVESNAEKSKEAGAGLVKSLKEVKGCESTAKVAKELTRSSDLKVQREKFTLVSADIIALIKHASIKAGSAFIQYCPMANNGNGGYWLAGESEIRNPYYGDQMLTCGEVKQEIKQHK